MTDTTTAQCESCDDRPGGCYDCEPTWAKKYVAPMLASDPTPTGQEPGGGTGAIRHYAGEWTDERIREYASRSVCPLCCETNTHRATQCPRWPLRRHDRHEP